MHAIHLVHQALSEAIERGSRRLKHLLAKGHQPAKGSTAQAREHHTSLGGLGRLQEEGNAVLSKGVKLQTEGSHLRASHKGTGASAGPQAHGHHAAGRFRDL